MQIMRNILTYRDGKHDCTLKRACSLGVVVLLLIFTAQLTSACTGPSVNETENTSTGQGEPSQAQSVQKIIDESSDFYGETVTVSGTVTESDITPLAFEMGGQMGESSDSTRYGEGADGLLIVNGTDEAPAPEVEVGQTVEVSGLVREFDIQEVEREIGTDLADAVFTYWASQPVLIATSIEVHGAETTQ